MININDFKSAIKKRTYSNAHIINLNYKNKKGKEINEEVILKRSNGILGDWKKIYPIVNKDNSINFLNLICGGWRNAVKLIIIAIFALIFWHEFSGILGYMDGDKYVIISHETFNKFCQLTIQNETELNKLIEHGNVSFLKDIVVATEDYNNG